MEGNRIRKVSAFIAAAAIVASAGSVSAQVTAGDAACRSAILKNAGKLGGTVNKTVDGCWKSVLGGKLPASTDCNSMAADGKGKIAGTATKTISGIPSKCAAIPANVAGADCPSPADADDGGDGVTSVAELANCQATLNVDGVFPLRNHISAPQVGATLAHANKKAIVKCAGAINKAATKLWSTVSKERGKCQTTSDKAAGGYDYGPGSTGTCYDDDAGGKIAGAVTKLNDGVDKSCAGLSAGELGLVGTCGSTLASIKSCVADAVKKNANGLTGAAFEFAQVCPTEVQLVVNAGTGPGTTPGAHLSRTFLDAGWTGFGHDADVIDGFTGRVNLACSNDSCNSCTVTANCEEGNCRCAHDASIVCNTPFVAGAPCGANLCVVHFGPPLALAAGGVATCVSNIIDTPFAGNADAGTGESTTAVLNIAKVHLGIDQLTPCPTCSGATIGAGGFCAGGQRNTLACTTDAINPTFGNVSYDCPPSLAANITGSGLKINLNLTDGAVSLPFGDNCDAPLGALMCACGACTLDNTVACQTNLDCSGAGLGTCTNAGGAPRQPNACSDLNCVADGTGTGEGTCGSTVPGPAGPTDTYCDGATKADGEGYVTCFTNADCGPAVGGGTCSVSKQRDCYLNPITADGIAGTDSAELVSAFCSGPTTSGGVNAAGGIPGAGRVRLDMAFTGYCPDGTTPYEIGGANCP